MSSEAKFKSWLKRGISGQERYRGEGYAELLEMCAREGLKVLEEREQALDTIANIVDDEGDDDDEDNE